MESFIAGFLLLAHTINIAFQDIRGLRTGGTFT